MCTKAIGVGPQPGKMSGFIRIMGCFVWVGVGFVVVFRSWGGCPVKSAAIAEHFTDLLVQYDRLSGGLNGYGRTFSRTFHGFRPFGRYFERL